MKKPNPQRFAVLCNKLAVFSDLMLDTLNEMGGNTKEHKELMELCNKLREKCEPIVWEVNQVLDVRTSTYLQEIATKVDVIFRKNFDFTPEQITESKSMIAKLKQNSENERS